ncbi:MAG: lasso peptide biosynthesis B2 protein [Bacteroidales bacterium]|nr:lasso peptide biosynthesis B2 protein [Bacteroidales bacterium]
MMFKLLRKYYSIDKTERKILNRTFLWLIYACVLARLVPLRWFSGLLGEFNPARLSADRAGPAGGKEVAIEINSGQKELIQMLRKNIRRWKRYLLWRVKCFEEAIAAKKVLEKYKINSTLYMGVDKNAEKELIAHAWLKVGNEIIIGKKGFDKFVVVGFYT